MSQKPHILGTCSLACVGHPSLSCAHTLGFPSYSLPGMTFSCMSGFAGHPEPPRSLGLLLPRMAYLTSGSAIGLDPVEILSHVKNSLQRHLFAPC